jgi:hypothetical protein
MALVVLHHVRRTDGQARGAGDILAAADMLLEMRRGSEEGPVRWISGRGRDGTYAGPFEVIMRDGEYDLHGKADENIVRAILDAVQAEPGINRSEIYRRVGRARGAVIAEIERLLEHGVIVNTGTDLLTQIHIADGQHDFMEASE